MKYSKKNSNRWEDHYSRKAKKERFPARSVYKLKEIQHRFHLIKKGDKVLDLGCSPGSWLLYAAGLTGNRGQVVGIDLEAVTIETPPHVRVYTDDILALDPALRDSLGKGFNVVLSDMAPATTGNKIADAARSLDLCKEALSLAQTHLTQGGSFVCKIFQSEDFNVFLDSVKKNFRKYKIFKPQSSRKASKEIYIMGMGKQ